MACIGVFGEILRQPAREPVRSGEIELALGSGTSPVESDAWQGVLRGFAVYSCKLTPAEVQQHYQTWTTDGFWLTPPLLRGSMK
jgi:hypothetical protein